MFKTLTIGIPTYNGGRYIALAIDSILNEIMSNPILESKTEIVVSDNASEDDVGIIVQKYKKSYPNVIQYYRNEANVGFDRNVDLVVKRATGKFVWFLSDDDIVLDGAIEHVLNVIDDHKDEMLALIYVNYKNQVQLNNQNDLFCHDGNDFLQKTHFKSGLISCNVVSKSIWQTSRVERFFDSGWIHFGYDLEALNPSHRNKSFIINKELVKTGGEMRWGQGGEFIYTGFKLVKIFESMAQWGYNQKTIKMAVFTVKGGYPLFIPLAKAKGLKTDLKLLKQFYGLYKHYPSFWLTDLPLLLIPGKLYNVFYTIVHRFKHRMKKTK
jgi:glycosyltransferase involved in cell wall biosynthesis